MHDTDCPEFKKNTKEESGICNLQLRNAKREQQLPRTTYKLVLVVETQQHFEHIKVSVSTELKLKLQKTIPE